MEPTNSAPAPPQRRKWVRCRLWWISLSPVIVFLLWISPVPQLAINLRYNYLMPRFREQIAKAHGFNIYEGLPHQRFESQLLADELARTKTVLLRDFPFYVETQLMNPADSQRLKQICTRSDAFAPRMYGITLRCGGYHPDYCLAWNDGSATNYAQFCFGCGELKAQIQNGELHCYVPEEARNELYQLLIHYHTNRPSSAHWPKR